MLFEGADALVPPKVIFKVETTTGSTKQVVICSFLVWGLSSGDKGASPFLQHLIVTQSILFIHEEPKKVPLSLDPFLYKRAYATSFSSG